MKMNIGTLLLIAVGVFLFAHYVWALPWTPWRVTGMCIAVPALLLLVVARLQLGRAFSVQAKASTLVTFGLYSRIRNPIYLFGALMIAGAIIWSGQPLLFLVFLVLIPLQVVRSRKEAKVLEEKFGAAYLEYKEKTWF